MLVVINSNFKFIIYKLIKNKSNNSRLKCCFSVTEIQDWDSVYIFKKDTPN